MDNYFVENYENDDSDSSDDSNNELADFGSTMNNYGDIGQFNNMNLNNIKYESIEHIVNVDSIDRDWINTEGETWRFQIRFNGTSDSNILEIIPEKRDENGEITRAKVENQVYYHSNSGATVPLNAKNIESFEILKLNVPNKKIYLGGGSFTSIINYKYLMVSIEEFSNVHYGSNKYINKALGIMVPISSVLHGDSIKYKFIELKNMGGFKKEFKPAPLNCLNVLTLNIMDPQGNTLKFHNDKLEVFRFEFGTSDITITTKQYFTESDFSEDDIVIFKKTNLPKMVLKNFIERSHGHKIIAYNTNVFNNEIPPKKSNQFKIRNNLNFLNTESNNSSQVTDFSNFDTSDQSTNIIGNLINTNLNFNIVMKIGSKIKSLDCFNTHIV